VNLIHVTIGEKAEAFTANNLFRESNISFAGWRINRMLYLEEGSMATVDLRIKSGVYLAAIIS